ncbi:MAG: Hsp20/alpha crystallin family protein [Candidatus Caldatribacteriota bacterium]|jgi:HSP20 family protein|nr:Hsp20/alpha crystallin family protein [Atribacterota bacterium]MDD3030848.1 Hsp20/alpha crystallin family protein [Atribacterota bacterium]MDD3640239.1 Hsp20/alpha crystallin family protein [Atribacterota bacterium]MDD4288256.1 Hsp20/alpha crystallin family protein [Atribacterota bacterium]MDD4764891.1 Hsp20/alpha crystallin family protein [Atribacterota bacterium]
MDLIRWEPRENLMRSFFDDFFDIMNRPGGNKRRRWEEGGIWSPSTDLIDKKDKLIARIELPGVEKKDVKISLSENNLTIRGEIEKDKETKKEDYYCCERAYGTYSRTISLPTEVDQDKIKASFKNGILEITMPKKPEKKPKEISIETE